MSRDEPQSERPEGLEYHPGFMDDAEERNLVAFLDRTEFHEITMRGQTAKRTSRHHGLRYDYESRQVTPTAVLPNELESVRKVGGERRVFEQLLEPRSAYVLGGAARSSWQRSIPPVKELRYPITLRTLKRSDG